MIFWFFGYPGIGKDYVAARLGQLTSIPHINADRFLTEEERNKLAAGTFTASERLNKLKRVTDYLENIEEDIAIADSLPDNSSREFLRDRFKDQILFILVTASQEAHEKRIKNRKGHFFTWEMLKDYVEKHWQALGDFPYLVLKNENLNEDDLKMELLKIYEASPK